MTEAKIVLASVSLVPIKVIKTLLCSYKIPDPLPWAQLVGPLVAFRYRFQFATLSGKLPPVFLPAISAGSDNTLIYLAFKAQLPGLAERQS